MPTLDKSLLARFERVVSYAADRACLLSGTQIEEDIREIRRMFPDVLAPLFSESLCQEAGDLLRQAAVRMEELGDHREAEEARHWAGKYSQPKTLEELSRALGKENA
jgi:hypothetical protein